MSSTLRSSPSFSCCSRILANLLSFPTRRSSDLFNALSALSQTALVVEGTVKEAVSEFSEDTGPWTRFELSEVVVLFGERSEEHTSELQSRRELVCRLLPEKTRSWNVSSFHRGTA